MAPIERKQEQQGERSDGEAIVSHPLYGNRSVPSGYGISAQELRAGTWGYPDDDIFPESAIPADISRQSFCPVARKFYVDILKSCEECGRRFFFFAREQKYWYEDLQFNLSADCVRCPECRRTDQRIRRRFTRYSEAVVREDLNDREFATMIDDAVFLFRAGMIRRNDRLRQLRNLALRRIPNSCAVQSINEAVAEL